MDSNGAPVRPRLLCSCSRQKSSHKYTHINAALSSFSIDHNARTDKTGNLKVRTKIHYDSTKLQTATKVWDITTEVRMLSPAPSSTLNRASMKRTITQYLIKLQNDLPKLALGRYKWTCIVRLAPTINLSWRSIMITTNSSWESTKWVTLQRARPQVSMTYPTLYSNTSE